MTCPGPELLAAMAEDRLDPAERDALLDHAAACDDCRRALLVLAVPKAARPALRLRPARRSWIPWAAAAALFVACLVGLLLSGKDRPDDRSGAQVPPRVEVPAPPKPERPIDLPTPQPKPEPPAPKPPTPEPIKPEPAPEKTPVPEPPPPLPAPRPEPPKPPTVVMAAVLDRVEGEVYVLSGPARTAAKAGQEIRNGEGIDCDGARSGAIVRFPDKTRLELAGETTIREIFDREPAKGRHLFVEKGAVKAEVTQQPQPMIFETSHGEAKVLGTILRITTDPDPKKGTRLEVEEGKVELKNAAGRTVLVDTGHMALAASGAAFTSKRLPKDEVLHAFDFEDGKRPAIAAKGAVERGPDRRLCLAGEPEAGASRLFFAGDGGLFTASGEETLSFDYWVDAQAASLNFHFWNTTRKVKNETEVEKLVSGKWTHFTVRLADLGVKEGEWIGSLFVQATGSTPRRLYVDNFVLSRPLNLKPK